MDYDEQQRDIILRIIGLLTASAEWMREAGTEAEDEDDLSRLGLVGDLIKEVLPAVEIPEQTPVSELGSVIGEQMSVALTRLAAGFVFTWSELADVHDSGRTDLGSADVLREMALQIESHRGEGPQPGPGEEDG
ncbi:hypothetical protein AB0J21_01315 [Streptomyces sp. NPDC049954]|uniref:hypothetical protein n=1 Tax=Streptomyces sp. NPDC049954 TaxID=3155779 RepID=UPI0034262788